MDRLQKIIDAYQASSERGREAIFTCSQRQAKAHPLRSRIRLQLVTAAFESGGAGLLDSGLHDLSSAGVIGSSK